MNTPAVSVCLLTYNHVPYIREAIDSILVQQFNAGWEVIIADDHSTDGTREILLEYQQKHPNLIRLILQPRNVVGENYLQLLQSARGKYVAFIEGDDYWADSSKLQKQFDFMESNSDCTICFHRVYEKYGSRKPTNAGLIRPNTLEKTMYTLEDLAVTNFIPSVSVFFRNGSIERFPSWFLTCPTGDYSLHLLNASKGRIGFIPDFMGVYRRHQGGSWGAKDHRYRYERLLSALDYYIEYFRDRENIQHILQYQYANLCASLSELEFKEGGTTKGVELLKKAFSRSPSFMDDWLEAVSRKKYEISSSKDYKLGWALRHPGFMIKMLLKNPWSRIKNLMFR